MSFKTKRWAAWRTVRMDDHVPGIKAYQTPGAAGINTGGWAIPFGGKIVVMAYAADDKAIYCIYDPVTDAAEEVQESGAGAWRYKNPTQGDNAYWAVWRDKLLICPSDIAYYFALERFCGFDQSLQFHNPGTKYRPDASVRMCLGMGADGGELCCISFQFVGGEQSRLVRHTLGGIKVMAVDDFYWHSISGSRWYGARYMDGYWVWRHADGDVVYTKPPTGETKDDYLARGSFGGMGLSPEATRNLTPDPAGGSTWIRVTLAGGEPYWTTADNLLGGGTDRPWGGYVWEYRSQAGRGGPLSDHDLDGIDHGVTTVHGPGAGPVTRLSNGWLAGVTNVDSPTQFGVYVLDPRQPARHRRGGALAGLGTTCYVGDYAIGEDFKLRHVLPIGRNPSAAGTPPQEMRDGNIVGSRELCRRRGSAISLIRDMRLQFDGYSFGPDWWWPGENPDRTLDSTLDFFGGDPIVMGRYPDYMWGRLNPLGADVSRGLGIPVYNPNATGSDPVFRVRNNQVVTGTQAWVTPGATGYAVLRGSLYDERLCYHEVYSTLGAKPKWNARGGRIVDGKWETLVDFEDIDLPPLGEDGWTVMGLCVIPPCRSLPRGGWLVCAELYFAPWDSWEWDPGPRDLTFRNTGKGWVPATWGYVGPLQIENWSPKLYTGYDEWTRGRSDYGPAALVVFDREGNFVECLNTEDMYPPYAGSEVAVLPGGVPRLLYRVKGGGTYSDCAEGWGCYQNSSGEADFQAPLFAVYELESGGQIRPGAGAFLGFVDMNEFEQYETKAEGWRWSALAAAYETTYPKSIWSPYGRVKVREGVGGSGVTLLSPRGLSTKTGIKGVASRSER